MRMGIRRRVQTQMLKERAQKGVQELASKPNKQQEVPGSWLLEATPDDFSGMAAIRGDDIYPSEPGSLDSVARLAMDSCYARAIIVKTKISQENSYSSGRCKTSLASKQ